LERGQRARHAVCRGVLAQRRSKKMHVLGICAHPLHSLIDADTHFSALERT
jgi:hypothetical protein